MFPIKILKATLLAAPQFLIKQTNKLFESVAKQHFQKVYWFGFERKAL
ncbi:hypothetical protein APA_4030 [Pseudanabaena sp. lw0831]|nr:hypothetical protein APA_4030 [Pseudanabaena sp. lw0831]